MGDSKDGSSSGGGSGKKVLSSKVSTMKFMQRAAAVDAAKRALDGPSKVEKDAAEEEGAEGQGRVAVFEGVSDPIIKYCPGRRSFGRFNVNVEDHATLVLKEFNRFRKAVAGQLRGPWTGGGGAPPPSGKVKQEGTSVSDQDMAAALGGKRKGGSDGSAEKKKKKKKVKAEVE